MPSWASAPREFNISLGADPQEGRFFFQQSVPKGIFASSVSGLEASKQLIRPKFEKNGVDYKRKTESYN
jgi:hypothetical protein